MKLKTIKPNKANPRVIRDAKFEKLKNSIRDFPAMMALRPIVVDETNTVLGGNMRLKALQDLGYTEIPDDWVKKADELTEEEKKRFIVADNVGFGEWDWEALANEWDTGQLEEWGVDVPKINEYHQEDEGEEFDKSNFSHTADSYLNSALRQIVLVYDIDTHKKTLDQLADIGALYDIEDNNSAIVLKLIEFFKSNKDAGN